MHSTKLPIDDSLNDLSRATLKAGYKVHTALGPGLLESIYAVCLIEELRESGLQVESEISLPVTYKGKNLNKYLRIDILVEKSLIVEIKAVEKLLPVHRAQVLTYLKLSELRLGLILNFNTVHLRDDLMRVIN